MDAVGFSFRSAYRLNRIKGWVNSGVGFRVEGVNGVIRGSAHSVVTERNRVARRSGTNSRSSTYTNLGFR